jgi:hypothetical protein
MSQLLAALEAREARDRVLVETAVPNHPWRHRSTNQYRTVWSASIGVSSTLYAYCAAHDGAITLERHGH